MAKQTQPPKKAKQPIHISFLKRCLIFVIILLFGGSAGSVFFWSHIEACFRPAPHLVVELLKPFSDPKNHSYDVQVVIISNTGERNAEDVSVSICYPTFPRMENISITYPENISDIKRENNHIAFTIPRLPKHRNVVVAVNASVNTITREGISVSHKDDSVEIKDIIYR